MEAFFLKLLNMSITAGWLVLIVLMLRPLLKKAPKSIRCVLWGMVGFRLLCPFSFESILSLIPSAETVPSNILHTAEPVLETGINSLNTVLNPIIADQLADEPHALFPTAWLKFYTLVVIWALGVLIMLIYALVSYLRLRKRVKVSLHLEDRVYLCDEIVSPFILGIFRPRIYLPSFMEDERRAYVIAHETAHLRRRDHWWKPLGFALLTVYWFHPLIWVAYILLCRDIELACDEKVIKEMEAGDKKGYSEALLSCSTSRRGIAACPLAFGEVGVKKRIKSVLNYKKPALWLLIAAVIICVAVAVFFMTDPFTEDILPRYESGTTCDGLSLELTEADLSTGMPYLKINWKNDGEKEVGFGSGFTLRYKDGGEWVNCDLLEERYNELLLTIVRAGREYEENYNLLYYDLSKPGTYRFSKTLNDGEEAWLEFWLVRGVKPICYEPVETTYSNGSFSYVADAEFASYYRFFNGILSTRPRGDEGWTNLGTMEPVKLDKDNFDGLFLSGQRWYHRYRYLSASGLRHNNARAWRLEYGQRVYMLLEQKNDEIYLAEGDDQWSFRWLFRLKSIDEEAIDVPKEADSKLPSDWVNLEKEIQKAILNHHRPASPDGYIHAVSYAYISGLSASSTPQAAYGGFLNDFTICIMAQHETYTAEEIPRSVKKTTVPAVVHLQVDDAGNYTLLEYTESNDPAVIKSKFPYELDEKLLDPWYYQKTLDDKSEAMAIELYTEM